MRIIITTLLSALSLAVFAQKQPAVWGYLRDSITHEPIVLASVKNMNTGKTVMTSSAGRFKIDVSVNQVLSFAAVGYHFDTIQYTTHYLLRDTLALILSPLLRDLGNVTVTTRGLTQYQSDSMERRADFLRDIGNHTIPTVAQANSGAGIALNISRFSKHEQQKRKALAFYASNEKEAYIDYRFTERLVKQYSGLKEEALQDFMQQYRPSYGWLRAHLTEEDIKYYINEQLKLYFKRWQ
jgi:hypothetical protein